MNNELRTNDYFIDKLMLTRLIARHKVFDYCMNNYSKYRENS